MNDPKYHGNDKKKIEKALEEIEKMIKFEEDAFSGQLHVIEELKKLFVDEHIPDETFSLNELTKDQYNLHVARHKWLKLTKELLES